MRQWPRIHSASWLALPWSPLHGGLLAGILRKEPGGRSGGGRAAEEAYAW